MIIPCYNSIQFIAEAIDCVIVPSNYETEVIVVDDGSTDGSADFVRKRYRSAVTVHSQRNKGAAAARNTGARTATGKYLLFLDADDTLEPGFLKGLVDEAERVQAELTFGNFVLQWPDGRSIDRVPKWNVSDLDAILAGTLSDDWVALHAGLWRTSFFRNIGGWNEGLSVNDDGELVFRALLTAPRVAKSVIARAIYRQHDGMRVSSLVTRAGMVSQLYVLEEAFRALGKRAQNPILQRALSQSTFETARKLHELGYADLAIRCETLWRSLGSPYIRNGSRANQWISALLGLKNKTVLAKFIRRLN